MLTSKGSRVTLGSVLYVSIRAWGGIKCSLATIWEAKFTNERHNGDGDTSQGRHSSIAASTIIGNMRKQILSLL